MLKEDKRSLAPRSSVRYTSRSSVFCHNPVWGLHKPIGIQAIKDKDKDKDRVLHGSLCTSVIFYVTMSLYLVIKFKEGIKVFNPYFISTITTNAFFSQ